MHHTAHRDAVKDEHSPGGEGVAGVIAPPRLIYLGFLALRLGVGHFWPLPIVGSSMPMIARAGVRAALAVVSVVVGNCRLPVAPECRHECAAGPADHRARHRGHLPLST
jgi:hypothetical protein